MQQFLNKLFLDQVVRKIKILKDNETSFTLTKDPESQNRTKCIDVIYYHIWELVDDGKLRIE